MLWTAGILLFQAGKDIMKSQITNENESVTNIKIKSNMKGYSENFET